MTDALSLGKPPPATASSDGGWTAGRPSEDSSGGRKDFQGFHEAFGFPSRGLGRRSEVGQLCGSDDSRETACGSLSG